MEEDQRVPTPDGAMRRLADAFSEFHTFSFHLYELNDRMRMLRNLNNEPWIDGSDPILVFRELKQQFSAIYQQIHEFSNSPYVPKQSLYRTTNLTDRHHFDGCCPLSPFNGCYYNYWQEACLRLAWLVPLCQTQIRLGTVENAVLSAASGYQKSTDLERHISPLDTELCETLTGLEKSIPDYHCLLPAYHALWQSRRTEELPEWQEWRLWISHHLGHLELHGMFLSHKAKETLAAAFDMSEIRSVGLLPVHSPFYQDSLRMGELNLRLSKMAIFCDLYGTSLL